MKKWTSLLLCMMMICPLLGCGEEEKVSTYYGENYRSELFTAERDSFYGAMYIIYEMDRYHDLPYELGVQTLVNMGVKSVRFDIFAQEIFPTMSKTKFEIDEEWTQRVHDMAKLLQDKGVFLLGGANVGWFNNENIQYRVPCKRDLTPGSAYQEWLELFELNWYRAATTFPEITWWEIGNEPNEPGDHSAVDGSQYSYLEKADVYTDMLYAASQGIHRANADNVVVMGGLAEFTKLGSTTLYKDFLKRIYDNIESGAWPSMFTDDYFQVACWHPYVFHDWDADYFVEENQYIYDYIVSREGKDKPVIFSEVGWSDKMVTSAAALPGKTVQETIAVWLTEMYETIYNRMPYVKQVHWFRAFNDARDYYWAHEVSMGAYGLYYDANYRLFQGAEESLRETDPATGKPVIPGSPKPAAIAYQQVAGGSGSLTLLAERAEDKMKNEEGTWDTLIEMMK